MIETITQEIQYGSDAAGRTTSVIMPIDLWQEIISEKETAYLLKSDPIRKHLLEAKNLKKAFLLRWFVKSLEFDPPRLKI